MSTTNLGIIKSEANPLTGTKVQLNTGGWFIAESSAVQKSKIESNKTQTITENGTVEITPSSGKEAMAKVTVTTNIPQTSQSYTWYECEFGSYETSATTAWGVIAFFTDATMTNQIPISDLDIGAVALTDFHALFIAYNSDAIAGNYGVRYNINTNSNLGAGIKAPQSASLYIDDGETVFDFQTVGGDISYKAIIDTTNTVTGSLAWALSEYRAADETLS